MTKLRVLAITHPSGVPPEKKNGADQDSSAWKMEAAIVAALKELGHEVNLLGVREELAPIRQAIQEWKPDLTFNLLEEFLGVITYEHHVVSFLELMRQPYTGCNPRGLLIARDKVLSKQLLHYHRIPSPRFDVFPLGRVVRPSPKLSYPLFVKSATEDASLGISQASIVTNSKSLQERIEFVHESLGTDALVEEYIEGRELYVAIAGHERLQAFPVWELLFTKMPKNVDHIATARVKWNADYQKRHGITDRAAEDLSEQQRNNLVTTAKRVYRALYLSGYARVDMRLSADGKLYVLEANPNPDISPDEAFARAAAKDGIEYAALIQRILNLGLQYQAEWKEQAAG